MILSARPRPEAPLPNQESVWDFPRPARIEAVDAHLKVMFAGRVVAETRRGYRAIETSHPPSYYFAPQDVDRTLLRRAARTTLCEWKGGAAYFDLMVGDRVAADAAWSYPRPTPDFAPVADYLAFYPGRVDACFVDGEVAVPQEGGFYGGWITSKFAGPFKGAAGTMGW
ncbi:DUF427 domain-containing protein [Fulvimarina sp. 2208YS6-2-32]|uniref:DUF427 domain-containing protein n=1 Tax=Fulvimarina uroteuthidis TaxID=3098149 RepID=A0ABU5I7M7_9HYPH|nr:DUF427 domain-containing protein [Fulvimarina sp. 2208YS6-2-32]MDY8110211.1 DUF427 domain-containing protein [Fulvimarina sp. 2208YS6-2-32]